MSRTTVDFTDSISDLHILIERNALAYTSLLKIEIIFREKITNVLKDNFGTSWLKSRCIPIVKERYFEAIKIAKSKKIWQMMPLTPLYFVDFPHLREIMSRADNWRDVFSKVIDEKMLNLLQSCESVRNSIAHNRFITQAEYNIVLAAITYLNDILGKEQCDSLLVSSTRFENIEEIVDSITEILERTRLCVENCDIIPEESMISLSTIRYLTWLDEEVIQSDVTHLKNIYTKLRLFNQVERLPGYFYKVEQHAKENNLMLELRAAIEETLSVKGEVSAKSL